MSLCLILISSWYFLHHKRFDFDFIILFSDILVIPYALGQEVPEENIGPILGDFSHEKLKVNLPESLKRLAPVFETIK